MSVDLEDWFCVLNLRDAIRYEDWDRQESRIVRNVERILGLFERRGVTATFFVLGWIAERFPGLIKEIARRGHEIGSHGYCHAPITAMSRDVFEQDLDRSLAVIRSAVGEIGIKAFRAPSFSVTKSTLWSTDVLQSRGFEYDSSVFPIGFHPDYGIGDAPLLPYRHENGMLEIPMSCATIGKTRLPCSGGGYFRLFPYAANRTLMRRCISQRRPVIFYFHPWEIDPGQPRIRLPLQKAIRHYSNLGTMFGKLERLLEEFEFAPLGKMISDGAIAA